MADNDDTTPNDLPEEGNELPEADNEDTAAEQMSLTSESGETLSNIGRIEKRPIVTEMEESYLSYAMSVIMSRALPDARDGLKPVNRRILVTLNDLGLRPGGRYRNCAQICGDVSGN